MGRKSKKKPAPPQETVTQASLCTSVQELKIADEVINRIEGLSGFALAKELHSVAVEICTSGNAKFINPNEKWAFDLVMKYKLEESERATPVAIIPAAVNRVLERAGIRGGTVDLGDQLEVDTIGEKMYELANTVLNIPLEHARLVLTEGPTELLRPFAEVAGLQQIRPYATKTEMTMISFLVKSIIPKGLNNACIKASPINGNGVFARRRIMRGTIVTMYPCDAFVLNIKGKGDLYAKANGENMLHTEAALLSAYSATVDRTGVSICGDPDKYSNAACGHIINDGSSLLKDDFSCDDVIKYIEESTALSNCYFISLAGVALAVVASKTINKGDEILTSYGAAFWAKNARGEM
jgi:hypothetical protein